MSSSLLALHIQTNSYTRTVPRSHLTIKASTPENGHANGHSFRADDDDDELDEGAGDRGEDSGSEAEGDGSDGRGECDGSGSDEKRSSSSSSSTMVGVCVRWLLLSSAALWAIWLVVGASLLYMLRAHIRLPEPFATGKTSPRAHICFVTLNVRLFYLWRFLKVD